MPNISSSPGDEISSLFAELRHSSFSSIHSLGEGSRGYDLIDNNASMLAGEIASWDELLQCNSPISTDVTLTTSALCETSRILDSRSDCSPATSDGVNEDNETSLYRNSPPALTLNGAINEDADHDQYVDQSLDQQVSADSLSRLFAIVTAHIHRRNEGIRNNVSMNDFLSSEGIQSPGRALTTSITTNFRRQRRGAIFGLDQTC